MNNTSYTQKDLRELSRQAVKSVADKYLRGMDIIDSRDVIEALKDLEEQHDLALADDSASDDECWTSEKGERFLESADWTEEQENEYQVLLAFAEQAEGYCADWRYGETLINDGYFERYAQELAEDTGALENCDKWPATCIDWEKAADELKQDYTAIDFDGTTFWTR